MHVSLVLAQVIPTAAHFSAPVTAECGRRAAIIIRSTVDTATAGVVVTAAGIAEGHVAVGWSSGDVLASSNCASTACNDNEGNPFSNTINTSKHSR